MYWVNFLHIYQPPTQFPDVLSDIVSQCYTPLFALVSKYPKVKIVLNINGSLTEQLIEQGYDEVIKRISELAGAGRVEFTGSACYHALLPKISESEIIRQIRLNEQVNKRYFGDLYKPSGFFPPEMAYSEKVGKIASLLGYKWVILEEGLHKFNEQRGWGLIFKDKATGLDVFFRNKIASLRIAFEEVNNVTGLIKMTGGVGDGYLITAVDGETFGHHRPNQFYFLEQVFSCQEGEERCAFISSATISEIRDAFPKREEIKLNDGCWAVTEEELSDGVPYPRWDYPGNKVQALQWEFLDFAINTIELLRDEGSSFWARAREILDKALNSDQFYWASGRPYWHFFMIERGAALVREAVYALPGAEKEKEKADWYYNQIVDEARKMGGEKIVAY